MGVSERIDSFDIDSRVLNDVTHVNKGLLPTASNHHVRNTFTHS